MSSEDDNSIRPFAYYSAMCALSVLLVTMLAFIAWFIFQGRWLLAAVCLPGVIYDLGLLFTTRNEYQSAKPEPADGPT